MRYLNATTFAIESHGTGPSYVKQTRAADCLAKMDLGDINDDSAIYFVWNRLWPTADNTPGSVGICRRAQPSFGHGRCSSCRPMPPFGRSSRTE